MRQTKAADPRIARSTTDVAREEVVVLRRERVRSPTLRTALDESES